MAAEYLTYQLSCFELEEVGALELPLGRIEDQRPVSRRALLSLDILRSPLLVSYLEGNRGSITSQIGVQLSLDAVVSRGLACQAAAELEGAESDTPRATAIVREAFKQANHEVYHYAHRMRASGKVAATGFVGAYDGRRFSIARVGAASSYVWRDGELVSLFNEQTPSEGSAGVLDRFIGANAQILVDLASLEVRRGDILLVTSLPARPELVTVAQRELRRGESLDRAAQVLGQEGIRLSLKAGEGMFVLERNVFVLLLQFGGPLIQLTHVIEE